ncbi:MAG: M23 family metallopeptidase [Candidatus Paceibacterota bacterium]
MEVQRRVHKKLLIKRTEKDSEHNHKNSIIGQMTDNAEKALPYHWNFFEWALFLAVIVVPVSLHSGFFKSVKASPETTLSESPVLTSAIDESVLSALQNPNPQGSRGGAEVLVNEGALVSSGPVGDDVIASRKSATGEISVYTVRSGDTLSHIADMYGVTANTILWANDLPKATSIREGQTLIILPIAGVQHIVKKGDTINSIAKKYDGDVDEVLAYNHLTSNNDLVVGETVVVPGGQIKSVPVTSSVAKSSTGVSGGSWLTHPLPGSVRSQGIHGYNAVDLAAKNGASVRSAGAGEVIVSKSSGWNGGYGQYIVIKHKNGAQTLYAHLSANSVGVGAYVSQGEVIGAVGNTGRSTGSHLHFEVRGASNPF